MSRALVLVALVVTGCPSMLETVRDRASAEWSCPGARIGVRELPGSAYQATGCGHRGTYACSRNSRTNEVYCQRER